MNVTLGLVPRVHGGGEHCMDPRQKGEDDGRGLLGPRKNTGYFPPVLAMPVAMYFCKNMNTSAMGSSVRTVMASRLDHSV